MATINVDEVREQYPDFFCAILHSMMTNPMIDDNGHSYQKEAIEQWMDVSDYSPITHEPYKSKRIRPNISLRNAIEKWCADNNFDPNNECFKIQGKQQQVMKIPVADTNYNQELKPSIGASYSDGKMMLSFGINNISSRLPHDICCVIDISGSMSSYATKKTQDGETEGHGLTILDIVKHSIRTIMYSLTENDRLSIVVFNSRAQVLFELEDMTQLNKTKILAKLNGLKADGRTNLWHGLEVGMNILRNADSIGRNQSLFLLTDGLPNERPARGEITALKQYLMEYKDVYKFSIYTFGFGYELETEVLYQIAKQGHGSYSFIPDSSLVGTIFVNMLSYVLSIIFSQVTFTINDIGETISDKSLMDVYLNNDNNYYGIGSIISGQTRNVVFNVNQNNNIDVNYSYLFGGHRIVKQLNLVDNDSYSDKHIIENYTRLHVVRILSEVMNNMLMGNQSISIDLLKKLMMEIMHHNYTAKSDYLSDLLKDISDQVRTAIESTSEYDRWGKHYILSLSMAHQIQLCNNFKDKGVQHYATETFSNTQAMLDKIFVRLPPPIPSRPLCKNQTYVSSMSTYYCQSDPCFDGEDIVNMDNCTTKLMKELKAGDIIQTTDNSNGKIKCIVKTRCQNNTTKMVKINDLLITPWHPIFLNGKWEFPSNINTEFDHTCEYVYNIVLETGYSIIVNNIQCATLGHCLKGDVIEHPYFGTNKIIDDLKQMNGWNEGLIFLNYPKITRDDNTNIVIKIQQ